MKRCLVLLMFPFLAVSQPKIPREARPGYDWMSGKNIKSHLSVIASDSMEGRETTMPGQHKAAQYLSMVFRKAGLKPLNADGSYLQPFNVEVIRTSEQSHITLSVSGSERTYRWLNDYVSFGGPDTTVTGSAVFVGYMDSKADSATAERMKGRIVLALAGTRSGPHDTSATVTRRRMMQFRSDKGSLATLVIGDPAGAGSFGRVAPLMRGFVEKGSMRLKGQEGRGSSFRSLFYYISDELASAAVQSAGRPLSDLRTLALDSAFTPVFLDSLRMTIVHTVVREDRGTENVIGILEGSDPTLKSEFVFFTAHFDHLGKSSDGTIYYGADDDGSGTSTLLTLAEAFSRNKVRPKRSLAFLAVTGEEKGLLGSTYYTKMPLIPLAQTMADFNIDMIGRSDPKHDSLKSGPYVYVIGSDKISSELDQVLTQANREAEQIQLDYQFNDENDPNQFYRRSDHYNFAKNGVPIAFFFTGEHKDYHKPTDTIDKILFDNMAKIGRLVYFAGWKAANYPQMFVKDGEGGGYK